MPHVLQRLLVELLAETDAIWRTPRYSFQPRGFRNIYSLRERYRSRGVPWKLTGSDTERRAGSRLVADAEAAGLITTSKRADAQSATLHIRLTDSGFWTARAIAGVNDLTEAWQLMQSIAEFSPTDFVCEHDLGVPPQTDDSYGSESWQLEITLTPVLTTEWTEQSCTVGGVAHYMLAAEGRDVLRSEPVCPLGTIPDPVDGLGALYANRMREARQRINTEPPLDPSEIGLCPLPPGGRR